MNSYFTVDLREADPSAILPPQDDGLGHWLRTVSLLGFLRLSAQILEQRDPRIPAWGLRLIRLIGLICSIDVRKVLMNKILTFALLLILILAGAQERKLRIIAFGAHPDDCELRVGGTGAKRAAVTMR